MLILSLATPALSDGPGRININTADVAELCTLPGVGPKRAEAILDYRAKKRFTRVSQLLNIRGIGHRTLKRLRPLVYVGKRLTVTKPKREETKR
jgi:competence protein ComEA